MRPERLDSDDGCRHGMVYRKGLGQWVPHATELFGSVATSAWSDMELEASDIAALSFRADGSR